MSAFAKANYPDSARDLGAMFHQRGLEMLVPGGMIAYINMQSWMFLSPPSKDAGRDAGLHPHCDDGSPRWRRVRPWCCHLSTTAWVQTNLRADIPGVYFRLVDSKVSSGISNSKSSLIGADLPDFQKRPSGMKWRVEDVPSHRTKRGNIWDAMIPADAFFR